MGTGIPFHCKAEVLIKGETSLLATHLIQSHVLEPEEVCNDHSRGSA